MLFGCGVINEVITTFASDLDHSIPMHLLHDNFTLYLAISITTNKHRFKVEEQTFEMKCTAFQVHPILIEYGDEITT